MAGFLTSKPVLTKRLILEELEAIERQCSGGRHFAGGVTTMGRALSETYARDPKFYGATFCCRCNRHLPVAEFVWTADDQVVGS